MDLIHDVNSTTAMRKNDAVTSTVTEVWESQSTGNCSLFVFHIMADLFYANYNITGPCYISGKSKSFYRNKKFGKCL